jgi:hypothetical protein
LLNENTDAFVLSWLFPIMEWNRQVRICGVVSPSLLGNLELFSDIWHKRYPDRYYPVRLRADQERESQSTALPQTAITSFSGGVDSCYTAWRHSRQLVGRRSRQVTAGITVQGFGDMPANDSVLGQAAAAACRSVLNSIGMHSIFVQTNIRQMPSAGRHTWCNTHGTAIAACLHMLGRESRYGLIPNSIPYDYLHVPYGTSPATDRLLSSTAFTVGDDGGETHRLQKMEALLDWPEAIAGLRVCNKGRDAMVNCGHCEKCIRTILAFRVFGAPLPSCFARDITDEDIRCLDLRYPEQIAFLSSVLSEAQRHGLDRTGWASAVRMAIRRGNHRMARRTLRTAVRQRLPGFNR